MSAYLNLAAARPSPGKAIFDATTRAGQAMDLAMRVRRHGKVSADGLRQFAKLAGLPASTLEWCIPELERAGLLESARDFDGELIAIEEQVGVGAPILDQAALVWENLSPDTVERCAIASSDHLAYVPMAESDHRGALEAEGFAEPVQNQALAALAAVGILQRLPSPKLHEAVLFSPYVWGSEAVEIAQFMKQLPPNERKVLGDLSRTIAQRPGTSLEHLSPDQRLLAGAQKAGLIDATRVLTQGGAARHFAFSPGLERTLKSGSTDVTHERKLFVAHILFGNRYANPIYGRIRDPLVLVGKLIREGSVGPATAIKRDYPLLEAKGIVRVEKSGGRAYLHLVKEDVARDGLELLRLALQESDPKSGSDNPLESLWLPGTFSGPEETRADLPALAAGAEAEIITSAVETLREEVARELRQESF